MGVAAYHDELVRRTKEAAELLEPISHDTGAWRGYPAAEASPAGMAALEFLPGVYDVKCRRHPQLLEGGAIKVAQQSPHGDFPIGVVTEVSVRLAHRR